MDDIDHNIPDDPNLVREKFCHRCNRWKPLDQFYKRGKKSKYLAAYCRSCHDSPFKYEKIICPHCKEKIAFMGIDAKGEFVKGKNDVITRLRKELKRELKKEKPKNKRIRVRSKNLKDVF